MDFDSLLYLSTGNINLRTCNDNYRSFTYAVGKSPLRPSISPVHLGYDNMNILGCGADNFEYAHQSDEVCSVTHTLSPARKFRSLASFKDRSTRVSTPRKENRRRTSLV